MSERMKPAPYRFDNEGANPDPWPDIPTRLSAMQDTVHVKPDEVYDEIKAERQRADAKYGEERNFAVTEWNNLIISEIDEALYGFSLSSNPPHDYRTEMIQVASLVVAAIESWDRQNIRNKEQSKMDEQNRQRVVFDT